MVMDSGHWEVGNIGVGFKDYITGKMAVRVQRIGGKGRGNRGKAWWGEGLGFVRRKGFVNFMV